MHLTSFFRDRRTPTPDVEGVPTCSVRPERSPRRLRPVAAAAGALLLVSATAGIAQADDGAGTAEAVARSAAQCPTGAFCIWSGPSYSGTFWSTSNLGLFSSPIANARSVWNRSGYDARTYSGASGTGTSSCWNTGVQLSNVSTGSVSVRTMSAATC